jgi:hypothetical protein
VTYVVSMKSAESDAAKIVKDHKHAEELFHHYPLGVSICREAIIAGVYGGLKYLVVKFLSW